MWGAPSLPALVNARVSVAFVSTPEVATFGVVLMGVENCEGVVLLALCVEGFVLIAQCVEGGVV